MRTLTDTDTDMLRAARRRLAEHLELRPATTAEALEIAAQEQHQHDALIEAAVALESQRPITAGECVAIVDRGPACMELRRTESLAHAYRHRRAGDLRQAATVYRLRADAWRRVASMAEGEAYRRTEAALRARVEFYSARVVAGK